MIAAIIFLSNCKKETPKITPEQIGQSVFEAYKENNFEKISGFFANKEEQTEQTNKYYENKLETHGIEKYNSKYKEQKEKELEEIGKEGHMDIYFAKKKKDFTSHREKATIKGVLWEESEIKKIQATGQEEIAGNDCVEITDVIMSNGKYYEFKIVGYYLSGRLVIDRIDKIKNAGTLYDGTYKYYRLLPNKYEETITIIVTDSLVKATLSGQTLTGDKTGWETDYSGTINKGKIFLSGTMEVEGTERELEETWVVYGGDIQRKDGNQYVIYEDISGK